MLFVWNMSNGDLESLNGEIPAEYSIISYDLDIRLRIPRTLSSLLIKLSANNHNDGRSEDILIGQQAQYCMHLIVHSRETQSRRRDEIPSKSDSCRIRFPLLSLLFEGKMGNSSTI
ncbi:hypothetical protein Trydic_g10799 [Trypoxylus dichotomus]